MDDNDNVTPLGAARFGRQTIPERTNIEDALLAALEWYRSAENKSDHVMILFGRTIEGGGSGTKFLQAGSYPHHGQMGLCLEAMHMIRESGHG